MRPVSRTRGVVSADGGNTVGDVVKFAGAGAPTNGVTGAGFAGKGSEYTDETGGKLYVNTNTKASPTWTVAGAQEA